MRKAVAEFAPLYVSKQETVITETQARAKNIARQIAKL